MDIILPAFVNDDANIRAAVNSGANKKKIKRNCRSVMKTIVGDLEVPAKFCKLNKSWFWRNKDPLLQLYVKKLLDGDSENDRILMFMNDEMLSIFIETDELGMDNTFSIESGTPYKQLLVISAQQTSQKNYEKISCPCAMFKLKDKRAETYSRCLKILKFLAPT